MKSYILLLVCISSLLKLSKAEGTVYSVYGDCNDVPTTIESNSAFCSTTYPSKKCQDYYNNPSQYLKAIDEDYDETDIAEVIYHKEKGKVVCQKDESNKLCPIGQYYIDKNIESSSNVNENEYIANSCSPKCIEATKSYIEAQKNFYVLKYPNKKDNFINIYNQRVEILKCTTANIPNNGATTNNNTQNNTNNEKTDNTNSEQTVTDTNSNPINNGVTNNNDNNNNNNDSVQLSSGESLSTNGKIMFLITFILINVLFH